MGKTRLDLWVTPSPRTLEPPVAKFFSSEVGKKRVKKSVVIKENGF